MNVAIRVTVRPNKPDPEGWAIAKVRDALDEINRIIPGASQQVPIGESVIIASADGNTAVEWHWLTQEASEAWDALGETERALDDRDFWSVVADFDTSGD